MDLAEYKQRAAGMLANKQHDSARDLLYKIVEHAPQDVESLIRLSSVCGLLQSFGEAEDYARRALQVNKSLPAAWINLGYALAVQKKHAEAVTSFREAIKINPQLVVAYHYLGNSLRELDQHEEAANIFLKALSIQPDNGPVYYDLGNTCKARGEIRQAQEYFRQSMRVRPGHLSSHTNLIACMLYDGEIRPAALFREQRKWGGKLESAVPANLSFDNRRDPERRLRVGYLSPDFCRHSVAYFFEKIIQCHDREQIMSVCYSDVPQSDVVTARIRALADKWHDTSTMDNQALYELIRSDSIDILVDLAGLTNENRMEVFARKSAPVQVNYLGYASSTGLTAIDYRITDRQADPEGMTDAFHTEELLRLPRGFLCYRPFTGAPPVAPLPAIQAGHITFGSFNNHAKITPKVVKVWSTILREVPGSCLLIKAHRFSDSSTRQRYLSLFSRYGITPDRIELTGQLDSEAEHLSLYGKVDIGLDTFPYNGTTTTCEALWMGVPVIGLAGDRHMSRVGLSILGQVGLSDFVAGTEKDYIQLAVKMSGDLDRLAVLRDGLRTSMEESFLCDGNAFTDDLESSYRYMWKKWLRSQ